MARQNSTQILCLTGQMRACMDPGLLASLILARSCSSACREQIWITKIEQLPPAAVIKIRKGTSHEGD